jgi:hypothetical protein
MDLDIVPYVGVGPLRFGMTPGQVHQTVGAPRRVKRAAGMLREIYPFEALLMFEGAPNALRLVEIGFDRHCAELSYAGVKLFGIPPRDALRRLLLDDTHIGEYLGRLILPKLGITMTGFHSGPQEALAVTAFERGRWGDCIRRSADLDRAWRWHANGRR